jgi:CDP-6-deoxy-D-xylo-4-hexulose-3-dehydrase
MSRINSERRIDYAGSVHDEREIEAVVEVLRGGPTSMRIGKNVKAMERRIADLFEKKRGVMCNSGSSALYLAYEAIDLQPGDEIVTSAVTFSTDVAPVVRKGAVPVFVDVTPDTFQIDVNRIAEMITPKTRAIMAPNLIGNCPDWDVIRGIADEHNLLVIEDSCDALGQTLRGPPTGTRADISLTSFALSHIITAAGTGGMVCFDNDQLADRALLFRRWGRRSELQLFGSLKGKENRFFSALDDGLEYDNIFIFDENSSWLTLERSFSSSVYVSTPFRYGGSAIIPSKYSFFSFSGFISIPSSLNRSNLLASKFLSQAS